MSSPTEAESTPDVLVCTEGTVWLFNPLTPAAQEWFDKPVQSEPWQRLATSLVVDHGFALGLLQSLQDAGLEAS
jgi:hypothetical protein